MTTFEESMIFLTGFIAGAKKINSTFKSQSSNSFRNGDNSIIKIYTENANWISGLEEFADKAIEASEICSKAQ